MDTTEKSGWIEQLSVPHRAKAAFQTLLGMGFTVVPSARDGLRHPHADVRYYCVRLLDHFLVPEALEELIFLLDDPDKRVRTMVLHTLACDRCKEGSCRPQESEVLPPALACLRQDDHPHVRAMAVEVVGQFAHTNPQAALALEAAHTHDPTPTVRKKAGWYAPGGPIYTRKESHRR